MLTSSSHSARRTLSSKFESVPSEMSVGAGSGVEDIAVSADWRQRACCPWNVER